IISNIKKIRNYHRLTLFPYTTLFRSNCNIFSKNLFYRVFVACTNLGHIQSIRISRPKKELARAAFYYPKMWEFSRKVTESQNWRSEEHTSELQSRENLVCRLLLEKKK